MHPFSRSVALPQKPRRAFAAVLRRSMLLASTARAICCLVALSTPYALFVLDQGLHP